MRDLQQPGPELSLATEAVETMKGTQEGILAHVLGFLAADHSGGDAKDHVAMALDQLLECGDLAGLGSAHESIVGVH